MKLQCNYYLTSDTNRLFEISNKEGIEKVGFYDYRTFPKNASRRGGYIKIKCHIKKKKIKSTM
jgi:hypothetical protein